MQYYLELCAYKQVHDRSLSATGAQAFRRAFFGEGTGPIFFDQLGCLGDEASLLDCSTFSSLGLHTCDHSEDAGIKCVGKYIFPSDVDWRREGCVITAF